MKNTYHNGFLVLAIIGVLSVFISISNNVITTSLFCTVFVTLFVIVQYLKAKNIYKRNKFFDVLFIVIIIGMVITVFFAMRNK